MFRNLIDNSKYVAFGCSHTWGVGVEANETWPYLLNAKNYGIVGASSDQLLRVAREIIEPNSVQTVFVLWPDWTRFEYIDHQGKPQQSHVTDPNRIMFMDTHTDQWCRKNFMENIRQLHIICSVNDIKFVDMTLYDLVPYLDNSDKWPISKLGHHYAPEWHQKVADLFAWADRSNHIFPFSYD